MPVEHEIPEEVHELPRRCAPHHELFERVNPCVSRIRFEMVVHLVDERGHHHLEWINPDVSVPLAELVVPVQVPLLEEPPQFEFNRMGLQYPVDAPHLTSELSLPLRSPHGHRSGRNPNPKMNDR